MIFLTVNVVNSSARTDAPNTRILYQKWLRLEVKYHKRKALLWAGRSAHYINTNNAEDQTNSVAYLRWLSHKWNSRWLFWKAHYVPPQPLTPTTAIPVTPFTAPTATTSGFPFACVAMAEEGGSNSVAGYYGFIYPPPSYPGGSGYSSWYSVPLSVQNSIALTLYHRYGGGAWGPLTRQKCGI